MRSNQPTGEEPKESFYLSHCLREVENRTGWGSAQQWTQSNYQRLSEQVQARSGTALSSSTLRRLFSLLYHPNKYRNPQLATRNALAAFVGYTDWDDFVRQQTPAAVPAADLASPTKSARAPHGRWLRPTLSLIIMMVACAVTLKLVRHTLDSAAPRATLASYLDQEDTSRVVFEYNVSSLSTDNIQLDFGDGILRRLDTSKHRTTHEYQLPGVYHAQLIVDDEPLAGSTVHQPTQGWAGNVVVEAAQEPTRESVGDVMLRSELFYSLINFRGPERLYASPETVQQCVPGVHPVYWTTYRNVGNFSVDGDDFAAEVRLKNDSLEGGLSCYDIVLSISGEKGRVNLEFTRSDCTVWTDLTVGEITLDGKWTDLSSFGQDFSYWRTVQLCVKDHQLVVSLDDEPIYQPVVYQEAIGALEGVAIDFKGSGSVDYVKLYDAENHNWIVLLDEAVGL